MTFCTITEKFCELVLLQGFIHGLLFCYREFEMTLYDYRDSALTFSIFAKILKWNCTFVQLQGFIYDFCTITEIFSKSLLFDYRDFYFTLYDYRE